MDIIISSHCIIISSVYRLQLWIYIYFILDFFFHGRWDQLAVQQIHCHHFLFSAISIQSRFPSLFPVIFEKNLILIQSYQRNLCLKKGLLFLGKRIFFFLSWNFTSYTSGLSTYSVFIFILVTISSRSTRFSSSRSYITVKVRVECYS